MMKVYKINTKNYYQVSAIKRKYPELFEKHTDIRNFINKYNVPVNEYQYAVKNNKEWVSCKKKAVGRKIFISQSWFHNLHPDNGDSDSHDNSSDSDSDADNSDNSNDD